MFAVFPSGAVTACMTDSNLPSTSPNDRDAVRGADSLTEIFDPSLARGERSAVRGKIAEYLIVALVVAFLAGYEWLRWVMRTELHPLWMTAFAVIIALYCVVRAWWLGARLRALQAGQMLWRMMSVDFSHLGERGYYLFDGVLDAQGLPLGPVLVGPSGVYSLMVRSAPPTGRPFEKADHLSRSELRMGGRPAFADPLGGARAAARRVGGFLQGRGVEPVVVTPVLVLPGWRIGSTPAVSERDVLVVSERTLAAEVLAQPTRLEPKAILNLCEALHPAGQAGVGDGGGSRF
jgi:hypothetical protein